LFGFILIFVLIMIYLLLFDVYLYFYDLFYVIYLIYIQLIKIINLRCLLIDCYDVFLMCRIMIGFFRDL